MTSNSNDKKIQKEINQGKKTVGKFLVTSIIVLIIIGFALSGFQSGQMNVSTTAASVDGNEISISQYQMALNRQVEFYNQMMGQPLSRKQMKQFGIEQRLLQSLVQQKVMANLANDLGVKPGPEEVAEIIRDQIRSAQKDRQNPDASKADNKTKEAEEDDNTPIDPAFYRAALRAQRTTPAEFEKAVAEDISVQRVNDFLSWNIARDKLANQEFQLKQQGIKVHVARFYRDDLKKRIEVTKEEIKKFVENPDNEQLLKDLYSRAKSDYVKEEQRQASHILLTTEGKNDADVKKKALEIRKKVTAKNFTEMAKKHTDEPQGKTSGGSLGFFGKGAMVKEFEAKAFSMKKGEISEPIKTQFGYHIIHLTDIRPRKERTLEDKGIKEELAEKQIRDQKNEELTAMVKETSEKVKSLLASQSRAELDKLKKQTNLTYSFNEEVNLLDKKAGVIPLKDIQIEDLLKQENFKNPIVFDQVNEILVLVGVSNFVKKSEAEKDKSELEKIRSQDGRDVSTYIKTKLTEQASISVNPSLGIDGQGNES